MNSDCYKLWLKENDSRNSSPINIWGGIGVWSFIFVILICISFTSSLWYLLLAGYAIFELSCWGKLAVSYWYYQNECDTEQGKKALERESYNLAIFQLKAIHEQLSKFLQKANEEHYKNMKKVLPGVWIHKDFHNLTTALKWLNAIIEQPVCDASIPKSSVNPPTTDASIYFHPEAIRLMRLRHEYERLMKYYGINDRQQIEEFKEELWAIEMELYNK
jgi:hypothetical protein